MSETASFLIDALAEQFGGNYVFVLDLLDQYQRDPQSVDASWRTYFDGLNGAAKPSTAGSGPAPVAAAAPAPVAVPEARPAEARPQAMVAAPTPMMRRAEDRSLMVPTILPG